MPLFLSDDEFARCSHDGALVAEKADSFIRDLYNQIETVKAQADAASITAEQTCSLLEQKYVSLFSEFSSLQSQNAQLNSSLDQRLLEISQLQADKKQACLESISKDGDIERLTMEASEFHKSKRQLLELLEQKDIEISEKSATIKCYLDKIVNLNDKAANREARLSNAEAELARSVASCTRLSQEKELTDRHNMWLNDELTAKINSYNELRRTHNDLEADLSSKLADAERRYTESSSASARKQNRVMELELQLTSLQEELCSFKDAAASSEERYEAEIATLSKLVDLYKESSEEWSKKAGELEGVIKALETHSNQVESDYKEKLDIEVSARKELEKEITILKEKLEKHGAELESTRSANEINLLTLGTGGTKTWIDKEHISDLVEDNNVLVPAFPVGVSGTALAASLLRDGWSLAKMYAKYQEVVDALRHEELGRKQSQAILERVLYEVEEKAGVILDERAEHERFVEAYSAIEQKLQLSLSEQTSLQNSISELKADLKRRDRDYAASQKEVVDLQKQVTVLLKECRDIQLRFGTASNEDNGDTMISLVDQLTVESEAQRIISERLVTFKDITGLVEQNTKLRSLVRRLSDQIETREAELKENFEKELQKRSNEAASKVNAVLARAEEQGRMIDSLHTSVAMYKKLYEEEQKLQFSSPSSPEAIAESRRRGIMLLHESSQEAARKVDEQASARVSTLEDDLAKSRSEIVTIKLERDKLALEAKFTQEKLRGCKEELEHQGSEMKDLISRDVELKLLLADEKRKVRECSESVRVAEELSNKLSMELSVVKQEKETLINSERSALDEVRSLLERVHRLQFTLETNQSAEEIREAARGTERRKQEEYIKRIEKECAEAKRDLQQERDNTRTLRLEREGSMNSAMKQVEDMRKELSNALHAVAAAESKAAVAEARLSDLEKKINCYENKVSATDGNLGDSTEEDVSGLYSAKEEIVKLKEEAQVTKDHMLQYKSIAEVNESALKQMEVAHEKFKLEADKLKKSLESEILSLRERVNELEALCTVNRKEAESAAAREEEVLASSLSEMALLKEENTSKLSQITILETQLSAVKDNLEEQRQKWRTAQTNYERQVILQSETIQELTKTSEALASLQEEASNLRNVTNSLKSENSDLRARWKTETSMLQKEKDEAEKKYREINEQNVILHSRLEALHIKFAEKERGSAGNSSRNTSQDISGDDGLQHVVNYLRRSKETAETEISLLKQEKLRLQAQLESAQKTTETTQATLRAERANSGALLYTDEEFKSLQLQVREINLLRESNSQLREENKHNFDECQKLREAAQKATAETENLETIVAVRENEVEALKKENEMQKMEKEHLAKKVEELERCQNISVEEYNHMREDVQQMQLKLNEKDTQLEEINKLTTQKLEVISHLEQDLVRSRTELDDKERTVNDIQKVEASLKSDVERLRRMLSQLKKKSDNLTKEKEELSKDNQALSKQLEDSKQGKRNVADASGEQIMREKEMEKDTRIQMLEKIVERLREDIKNQKDQRSKVQRTIRESYDAANQEKKKLEDEFAKHKQALRNLADEVGKLKPVSSTPEGTSAVQVFSGSLLDEMAAAYLVSVENFEKFAQPYIGEVEHSTASDSSGAADASGSGAVDASGSGAADASGSGAADASASGTADASGSGPDDALGSGAALGQTCPVLAPSMSGIPQMFSVLAPSIVSEAPSLSGIPPASSMSGVPPAKTADEREGRLNLTKHYSETRKAGRKLVRPRIMKPEEPPADIEMSELEEPNDGGKTSLPQNVETQDNPTLVTQPTTRKRQSTSELQEEALITHESNTELSAPVQKKSRGSDSVNEVAESQSSLNAKNSERLPATEESNRDESGSPHGSKEEVIGGGDDESNVGVLGEPSKSDDKTEAQLQNEMTTTGEEVLVGSSGISENKRLPEAEQEEPLAESESDQEDGELAAEAVDLGGVVSPKTGEGQMEDVAVAVDSPDEMVVPVTDDTEETRSLRVGEDGNNEEGEIMEEALESSEKLSGVVEQAAIEVEQIPNTGVTAEQATSSVVETGVTDQDSSIAPSHAEINQVSPSRYSSSVEPQVSPANNSSTTINLNLRARERAALRQRGQSGQAGLPPPSARGRGRAPRGRPGRGFRGRGPTSGQQG